MNEVVNATSALTAPEDRFHAPDEFFRVARVTLFAGSLTQAQVDGIKSIIVAWPADTDIRWLAYGLGTAYHETGQRMEPIPEWGHGNGRPYGVPDPKTGLIYYGRGLIQLTWKANYARAERELPGSDLVAHPDNALKPDIAAKILVSGMSEGWFTGVSLEHYFPLAKPTVADWVNARRIVNGLDCAAKISNYALKFKTALVAGGYTPTHLAKTGAAA